MTLRRKDIMNGYDVPGFVTASLYAALVFSLVISYNGVVGIIAVSYTHLTLPTILLV